jgi:hypothetical protein
MANTPNKKATSASLGKKISIDKLPPESLRSNMKTLLLANPNYFGNLKESDFQAVLSISGDTAYESIGCVGFNPQLNRMEAVVYINQDSGYDGDICSAGSQEFVRFYLSYDGGTTWQDQGLTTFTVYDVPGQKPLEYDVTLSINPPEEFCFIQNLPKARAILSWNTPPPAATPGWTPVWGNVVDVNIQIEGFEFIIFSDLLAQAKVELAPKYKDVLDLSQPVNAKKPKPLSGTQLHSLYKGGKVPGHRYLFSELKEKIAVPAGQPPQPSASVTAQAFASAAKISPALYEGVNLTQLIEALLGTDGDTTFEQLNCVGLNPNSNQLVGILNVKESSGYSGGPCTAGSQEYVAFWTDWGSGWTYAGTTSVTVRDFSTIPAGGLQYSVFLPIDFSKHQQPCGDGAKTAKVRAVLSWAVPPSSTDPYAPVTWGNSEETTILVPAGITTTGMVPFLSRVGDIAESSIDGSGFIQNAYALETGAYFNNAPFGGRVTIAGFISNPVPGLNYRVVKKPHGAPDTAYVAISNEPIGLTLTIDQFSGGVWTQSSQTFHDLGGGYYPYENYTNHLVEANIMQVWYTGDADSGNAFDLRIDLSTDGNPAHDVHSNVVTVMVNNTPPVAFVDIDLGGGGSPCGDFSPGDPITGNFTATSQYFGSFSFVILPPGPANGVLPTPASGQSTFLGGAIADPGETGTYSINTTGMDVCGYSLTIGVWDRTNVNSGATNLYAQWSAGFCLQAD